MLIPESFGAANRKLDFEQDLQQSPGDDDIQPAQQREQEVIQPVSSSAENTATNGDAAIVSLSIDNMEETNVNDLQKGSIAENTELSAKDKDADPTDIEEKDTTVGQSEDQASTPAEASETPPNNEAEGHLEGQLEATLPDFNFRTAGFWNIS